MANVEYILIAKSLSILLLRDLDYNLARLNEHIESKASHMVWNLFPLIVKFFLRTSKKYIFQVYILKERQNYDSDWNILPFN